MNKCPKCGNYTIDLDAYRGFERCLMDNCRCIVLDKNTYSYLQINFEKNRFERVKVKNGIEKEICAHIH